MGRQRGAAALAEGYAGLLSFGRILWALEVRRVASSRPGRSSRCGATTKPCVLAGPLSGIALHRLQTASCSAATPTDQHGRHVACLGRLRLPADDGLAADRDRQRLCHTLFASALDQASQDPVPRPDSGRSVACMLAREGEAWVCMSVMHVLLLRSWLVKAKQEAHLSRSAQQS